MAPPAARPTISASVTAVTRARPRSTRRPRGFVRTGTSILFVASVVFDLLVTTAIVSASCGVVMKSGVERALLTGLVWLLKTGYRVIRVHMRLDPFHT